MKNTFATKLIAAYALFYWGKSAFSHEGHGLQGVHWHASDAGSFVALAVAIAVAVWLSRGGK
jgi:hypothetical protein